MTNGECAILRTVATTYHAQEGPHWNAANQSTVLQATARATRDRIQGLVEGGWLVPGTAAHLDNVGFSETQWVGYPGSIDEEGNPLDSEEANVAKAKQEDKAKKTKVKSRAVTLTGVSPADFFHENAKKKTVFKPGHDAKLAAMFKRIINGKGDADDIRLLKAKALVDHEKVESSAHLRGLRNEAMTA